jgi:hypothetical protein
VSEMSGGTTIDPHSQRQTLRPLVSPGDALGDPLRRPDGMDTRQPNESFLTLTIRARVSDMDDVGHVLIDRHGGAGGPHSGCVGCRLRLAEGCWRGQMPRSAHGVGAGLAKNDSVMVSTTDLRLLLCRCRRRQP